MELKTSKQIYNNYIIGHTKSKAITKKIGPKEIKHQQQNMGNVL